MCKRLICLVSFIFVWGLMLTSPAGAELVGWWRLDEISGTVAHDSSGSGNHGTINGAQSTAGQIGKALLFDEVDDHVVVPDFTYGPEFSVAFWFKATDNTGSVYQYLFSHGPFNTNNSLSIYFAEENSPEMGILRTAFRDENDGQNSAALDIAAGLADGNWHHYALTVSSATGSTAYIGAVSARSATRGGDAFDPPTDLYIGGREDLNADRFFGGVIDDVRIYNQVLTEEELAEVMVGEDPAQASDPSPADGAVDVPRETALRWTPGEFAAAVNGHRLYLSESFGDVNDGIGGITLSTPSYSPAQRLEFETTYFWRVDEVNAPPGSTVFPGLIWSFTTEPVGYPVDGAHITATASSIGQADFGPEKTIDGSGLDENGLHSTEPADMWLSGNEPQGAWIQYEFDKIYKLHEMWVWNSNQIFEALYGFGIKDVAVEYSTDGTNWTALAGVSQFPQAPGSDVYAHDMTVDFGGAAAKLVKLTAINNWGGLLAQYGLSEVRFFAIPVSAREPSPDTGAIDVGPEATLSWRAGREAATHDVYVSTDEQAVTDGTVPAVSVAEANYSTALNLSSTYYWRVDEVNDAETPSTWQGDVWSFSTPDYLVVEDFEDYNDYPPYEIYSTWLDGYENPANGSQVGYLVPPAVEMTIVRSGAQSMPLLYSNTGGAAYSEATRTFAVPRDWTKYGIATLRLWFYGTEGNAGQLYAKINGVKIPYDGDAGSLAIPAWQSWKIDLSTVGANLQSVTTLTIGVEGNAAAGTLYVDDIRLYADTAAAPAVLAGHWTFDDSTAADSSGNGHDGAVEGAQATTGQIGAALLFDEVDDLVLVPDFLYGPEFSVSFWFKSSGNAGTVYQYMFSHGLFNVPNSLNIYFGENERAGDGGVIKTSLVDFDDAANDGALNIAAGLADGNWHHYALTVVGSGIGASVYIDGIIRNSASQGGDTFDPEADLHLGARTDRNSQRFFGGALDDVRVYNGVLTTEEIALLAGTSK